MQNKKNKYKILYSIFAILLGILLIVFGGYDDSPGAQLLGIIITIIAVWKTIKTYKT